MSDKITLAIDEDQFRRWWIEKARFGMTPTEAWKTLSEFGAVGREATEDDLEEALELEGDLFVGRLAKIFAAAKILLFQTGRS